MRFTLVCNHLRYRTTFDPRTFDQALVKRVAEAKDTAQQFAFDLAEGKINPSDPGFHQGAYNLAPKEPEVIVPAVIGELPANCEHTSDDVPDGWE